MGRIFRATLTTRSYEMDSFGHVNNAAYLYYLEAARCEYMRQVGLSVMDFHRWGAYPILAEVRLVYKQPLVADEEIWVEGEFTAMRRASFHLTHRGRRAATGDIVFEAELDFLFVTREGRPVRIPTPFAAAFGDEGQLAS